MNIDTILRLLKNSGFHAVRADAEFVYMEDPSCIIRSLEVFIEYAWIAITALTGLMLFGWGISKIRGATDDIFTKLKNLVLIFGVLSVARPVINLIYGDDLFGKGCDTISVSIKDVNALLATRNDVLKPDTNNLYEGIDIYDSWDMPHEIPYSVLPVAGAGSPSELPQANPSQTGNESGAVYADSLPVFAVESGSDVIYTTHDGSRIKYSGGSRSWRNSNPGNIRYSDFSKRVGAIGQAGGFAVFPDAAVGMYAIEALLRTDSYNKLTIAGAISRYAPPSENNTAGYHRRIEQLTGLSINMRMSDLSPEQLTSVANAIRTIEGWNVGTTQRI